MAKNKNYHNYKNYSKPNAETEKVEEVVTTEVPAEEPAIEEVSVVEEPVAETVQEEPTPAPQPKAPAATIGVVAGCAMLRVRAAASTTSDVICQISVNTEVTIDKQNSTADFYKVCTSAGVEGFCMKKFITVK